MDDFDTLWIIDSKGLCLIQQVFDPNQDSLKKSIFSSFISAVMSFSDQLFDDNIDKISMGKLDVFFQIFDKGKFIVAIAAKREADEKVIHQKMQEVGAAFDVEYGHCLTHLTVCLDDFEPFTDTLDRIFGTKTIRIIPEHDNLLKLLKKAEDQEYSEKQTVDALLKFFEKLTASKQKILLQRVFPVIETFIGLEDLSFDQSKRFQDLLSVYEK